MNKKFRMKYNRNQMIKMKKVNKILKLRNLKDKVEQ